LNPRRSTIWLVLPVMALTLAVASAAPTLKNPSKPKPYHTTRLGTTLVYDQGGREETWEVTAVEEKGEETVVTMSVVSADAKLPLQKVAVSAKGVFLVEVAQFKVESVCQLKFPVKEGDTWEYHVAAQKGLAGQSGTATVGKVEEVQTPAGKFKAVRVETVITTRNGAQLGPPETYSQWYDPDLGLVKLTGPRDFTRVLKSVTRSGK
jgi:hypothetical protein